MTYFFETYGCQMNLAESAAVESLFLSRGWSKACSAECADAVIINTCSVRKTAENRVFGRLGYYAGIKAAHKSNASKTKPLTVIVMGCMAERLLHSLKRDYPVVDYVVGTFAKQDFVSIIDKIETGGTPQELSDSAPYKFAPLSYEQGSFSSFVPIMHGCDNFCSYCIVPYVRGREVSRPVSDILKEIDFLSSCGVKEITLLGQNVNSYKGVLDGRTVLFPELSERIAARIDKTKSPIRWVRFLSSHPKDMSDALIDVIASQRVFCHHIHLPVQHSSDKILKAMNRRYTQKEYLSLAARIRERMPDVSLTTDVMVGFPGETEEDVAELIDFMERVRYMSSFMYYYNQREGTPAACMAGQVPVEVKKARLQRVIDTQMRITAEEMKKRIGHTEIVLAEYVSRDNSSELLGKTERHERVVFKAPQSVIGTFISVRIDALSGITFRGHVSKLN